MANNPYYKTSKITKDGLFSIPKFVYSDFSDIPGKDFLVQRGDRLDIIAEQVYHDSSLWKAIAIYNGISYFFDIQPGDVIKLPYDISKVVSRI